MNPDVSEKSGIWGERNGTQDVRRNCKEAEKRFFLYQLLEKDGTPTENK